MEKKQVELQAEPRDLVGKKVRFLRRQGLVPGHIYGGGQPTNVQMEARAVRSVIQHSGLNSLITLQIAGSPHPVILRGVRRDSRSGSLLNVDLEEVALDETVHAQIPLVLDGEAPATKAGAVILRLVDHLNLESLPGDLPRAIHVDISHLQETGQTIHVRDLSLPPTIKVLNDPDEPIVKAEQTRAEAGAAAEEQAEQRPAGEEAAPGEAPAGRQEGD